MNTSKWDLGARPYDLRERLLDFACLIVRVVEFLRTRGGTAAALSHQLLKAGTSAGANYEEADDGSSPQDKAAKRKIVLRELKETRFRLLVLQRSGFLSQEHQPVIAETTELIRIVATIIRNDRRKQARAQP